MNISNPNEVLLIMASNEADAAGVKLMLHALEKVFNKSKWSVVRINTTSSMPITKIVDGMASKYRLGGRDWRSTVDKVLDRTSTWNTELKQNPDGFYAVMRGDIVMLTVTYECDGQDKGSVPAPAANYDAAAFPALTLLQRMEKRYKDADKTVLRRTANKMWQAVEIGREFQPDSAAPVFTFRSNWHRTWKELRGQTIDEEPEGNKRIATKGPDYGFNWTEQMYRAHLWAICEMVGCLSGRAGPTSPSRWPIAAASSWAARRASAMVMRGARGRAVERVAAQEDDSEEQTLP